MSTALTVSEAFRFSELEGVVERGIATFVEVGGALAEIRDKRLYRESHKTFEAYCRERWGMSKQRAYEIIGASDVIENVRHGGQIDPPNERVARELTKLNAPDPSDGRKRIPDVEAQRAAWQEAVQTAPKDDAGEPQVTAKHVAEVVERRRSETPQPPSETRAPRTRPTPARLQQLVDAALGARDVSDEDIASLRANDLMIQGLRAARDTIDRILTHHARRAS